MTGKEQKNTKTKNVHIIKADVNVIVNTDVIQSDKSYNDEILDSKRAKNWLAYTISASELETLSKKIKAKTGRECNFPGPEEPVPEPEWFRQKEKGKEERTMQNENKDKIRKKKKIQHKYEEEIYDISVLENRQGEKKWKKRQGVSQW